jgi:hypothetical protein
MKQKKDPQPMTVYFPLPLLERVRESAKAHRRSFNQEVLWLIEEYLKQGVRQPAKPTYQEWDSKLKNLCLDLQDSEIPDTLLNQKGGEDGYSYNHHQTSSQP